MYNKARHQRQLLFQSIEVNSLLHQKYLLYTFRFRNKRILLVLPNKSIHYSS